MPTIPTPKIRKPIITIQDWDKGIADDPYTGFQMIRDLNENKAGIASCGFYFSNQTFTQSNLSVTTNSTTNTVNTVTNWVGTNPYFNGIAVTFSGSSGGITAGTVYYTYWISNTSFKICASLADVDSSTFVTITGNTSNTVTFITMETVTQTAINPVTGYWYAVDSSGKVWSNEWSGGTGQFNLVIGNTTTNSAGNGIAVWKNYLIVFRNTKIDAWGPLTSAIGSRSWTNDWQTAITSGGHNALVGQDDILYFCDGRYIGSILEKAGQTFAPGTGATFTYATSSLTLPSTHTSVELEEYGIYLAIGVNANKQTFVVPWDRVSTTFNFPIEIPETSIQSLVTINNVLYVITNARAAIYATNLSSVSLVRVLPNHLMNAGFPTNGFLSIGSATKFGGKLYLGVTAGTTTDGNSGVYSLDVTNGTLKLANSLSSGVVTSAVTITAMGQLSQFNDGTPYYFAFNKITGNPTRNYIDSHIGNQFPYTAYESYIISPMYELSYDAFRPYALLKAVFYFQYTMGTSDAVKLEWRKAAGDSWTQLGLITAATANAVISPTVDIPLTIYANQAQFKISIKSDSTSGSTFVRLKKVEII